MQTFVSFRCSACQVKLKAPVKLVGRARPCPACREHVVLQPVAPAPADPLLVFEDFSLPPHLQSGRTFKA